MYFMETVKSIWKACILDDILRNCSADDELMERKGERNSFIRKNEAERSVLCSHLRHHVDHGNLCQMDFSGLTEIFNKVLPRFCSFPLHASNKWRNFKAFQHLKNLFFHKFLISRVEIKNRPKTFLMKPRKALNIWFNRKSFSFVNVSILMDLALHQVLLPAIKKFQLETKSTIKCFHSDSFSLNYRF